MANAFASRNHYVFFTDYLLNKLNKREVVAVAAHEVTHIQKRHSMWKLVALIGLIFSPDILFWMLRAFVGFLRHSMQLQIARDGAGAAQGLAAVVHFGDQVIAFPEIILVLYIFALALFYLQSRYMEHVADAGSVQLSGDPEAAITALLKLSRLNLTPVQWDKVTGTMLTHPSTLKRVQRIAVIGQVAPERLEQLLQESHALTSQPVEEQPLESNETFREAASRNPVISTVSAAQMLVFKQWALRFLYIVPPALVAVAVHRWQLPNPSVAYIIGGAACFALFLLISEWQTVWGRTSLMNRFHARLRDDGVAVAEDGAELVALSPHAYLCAYTVAFTWDTGLLLMGKNRLCYAGDQIRFALRPEQVLGVRIGPGIPQWLAQSRIYIDWQTQPGSPVQTWNLEPKSPCAFWRVRRQIRQLHARLERWRAQPSDNTELPAALRQLEAPAIGEVTGEPIRSVVTFRRFLKIAFWNQVLAIMLCLAVRVPSVWYVCCMDFLLVAYSFSPFWFYREPARKTWTIPVDGDALQNEAQTGD